MINNKVIFFTHHTNTEFERINFEIVRNLNSGWDIIPIGFEGYNLLPGSTIAYREKYPCNYELSQKNHSNNCVDWYSADILFAEAYRHHSYYKNYFFYEYDTICNVSIDSFFDTSVPFFSTTALYPRPNNYWNWIRDYLFFKNARDIMFGQSGVTTCVYFENSILRQYYIKLLENPYNVYDNMFSELRLGTIIGQICNPTKSRPDIDEYINWKDIYINANFDRDFFYHPVKKFPDFFLDKMRNQHIITV